jgi:O-antigen ligase
MSPKIPPFRNGSAFFARSTFLCIAAGILVTAVWTVKVAPLLEAVGRDATFTERTKIWQTVLEQDIDTLLGCGYYSFWLAKGELVWAHFVNFQPHSAHNGYLETYLDGGIIGCVLLGAFLIYTSWRNAGLFSSTSSYSRVLFAITMMALMMNFSETYLFRLNAIWCSLVLATLASHRSFFQHAPDVETTTLVCSPEAFNHQLA